MCVRCGKEPPSDRSQLGRCSTCLDLLCKRVNDRRKEKAAEGKCVKCQRPKTTKSHCDECYSYHLKKSAEARSRLKDKVFAAYGGYVCACCSETEPSFLSIDHINGGGCQHRKEIGGGRMYYWLRDQGFPPGFQVLCMNCQYGRKNNKGICPHNRGMTQVECRQTRGRVTPSRLDARTQTSPT